MMTAKQRSSTVLLCLAIIFKFWLIAGMEITDDANDPAHYLEQILQHKGLCYGPGTGYVGRLFYGLGIPFRLGIEVGFLASALLVVWALLEWPTKSVLALGVYLFVIFNPAIEELLSHLMSDQVWLVEILTGLSVLTIFSGMVAKIRWLAVTLGSIFLGLSVVTRSTFVPLLAIFVIWAIVVVALSHRKAGPLRIDRPLVVGYFLCLYAIVLFYYSVCLTNSRYNDFFGLSAFDSREYQQFYMSLQSVGESTGERYFPIDDARLKLIGQAGPRSSWFVDQMGKDKNFRKISLETYGKPGIALCWFHWAVFETTDPDGDLKKPFALFKEIEGEIAQAAREQRLKVRGIIPLPDCRIGVVVPALPDAFLQVASLVRQQPSRYAWAWNEDEPKFDDPAFTCALHRLPVTPNPFRDRLGRILCAVYAWVYTPLLPALALIVTVFLICVVRQSDRMPAFSPLFLARQIFLVTFVVLFLWYALFDASGLLATPRYLIYNNVMLPVLLIYYLRETWRLLRGKFESYSTSIKVATPA